MSDDIPEVWHTPMERKGIKVSYRALSERAGISHEAARRVVRGWSVKDATVQKVADALGVDREVVHELRGETSAPDVWEPPRAASLLTHEERDALSRLISLMTEARKASSHGNPAPNTSAGSAPADMFATDDVTVLPDDEAGESSPAAPGRRRGRGRPRSARSE